MFFVPQNESNYNFSILVDDGAILDIVLDNFRYNSPAGYDPIMLEKSIL